MAVDLGDLIIPLKMELSPPGSDLFSAATDSEWVDRLVSGFWNARMDGFFPGYVEADGQVTPTSGDTDMPRELQQVIVFMAAYSALMSRLGSLNTAFRAKAGAVEYETKQAASLMTDLLKALRERYATLLGRLGDLGYVPAYVIDSVIARNDAMTYGDTWFVGTRGSHHSGTLYGSNL